MRTITPWTPWTPWIVSSYLINSRTNVSFDPLGQCASRLSSENQGAKGIAIWSKADIFPDPAKSAKNISLCKAMYTWLLIKICLSGNGHSLRIKMLLSRNFRELQCLSFAEPVLCNHDIQLSRNFCEKKCYFPRTRKKQTFTRVSNITCTAFAIKTPYKDL